MTTLATTVTRVLLLLYPPSFRRDAGAALVADVRRRATDLAASRAGVGVGVWLIRLIFSLLGNAAGAWVETFRRRRSGSRSASWSVFSWIDLKLAMRMLVKHPGLTLTSGLGILVAMTIQVGFFSWTQSYFYPTVPLSEGDRLVALENWDRLTTRETRRSLYDYGVWSGEMKSVEDMSAFQTVNRNIIADDNSIERVYVAEMTPSGFRLARVAPYLGRTLVDADAAPGARPVIVIGFDIWRTRFASAPDVIGKSLRLGVTPHTIVGVMPAGFQFPKNHHFWIPLSAGVSTVKRGEGPWIYISGRLRPGFDMAAANAELSVIGNRMAAEFPDTHKNLRPEVLPYTYQFAGMSSHSNDGTGIMNMLVAIILVVVCVNIAILVYARTATRLGEIAVRTALGATRRRIVAQFFAESLVLSALPAAGGVLIVKLLLDQVTRMASMPEFWQEYRLSTSALLYAAALTVLAAVITGVIPALRATGRRVQAGLAQFNGRGGLRLGRTWSSLIVFQVAIASAALPIVVALGVFQIRDVFRTPRFPVEQILFAQLRLDPDQARSPEHLANIQAELSRRLDAEPGVTGHAFTLDLPGVGVENRVAIEHDAINVPAEGDREIQQSTVDLNFFRTFDVSLLAGRAFQPGDRDDGATDVVVVNRAFVNLVLGGGDALGRRIRYDARGVTAPEHWYQIVGVVENIDANPLAPERVDSRVYHPLKKAEGVHAALAVRFSTIDSATLAVKVGQIAASLDPALDVDVVPLADIYRLMRLALSGSAIAIGVALLSVVLLAAAGIYALMSFTVVQRRREIAIRTALGAEHRRLLGGILGGALRQISLGVVIGIGLALLLNEASQREALAGKTVSLLSATAAFMCIVGVIAALVPARRGLQIAPAEVLKSE